MKQKTVAAVGAAETTELGRIPNMSQIQLHAEMDSVGLELDDALP